MTRFNITNDIYEMIAERCTGTFYWDCIELANGFAVVFVIMFVTQCKYNE